MQAAVLTKIGAPLEIREVARPAIGPDDVLVEVHTCGICRTDLHMQDGLAYIPALPHIPGHEPAGVVIEVGDKVRNFNIGDRVVPHLFVARSDCFYSRSGSHAQAQDLEGILGVTLPGGFAEFMRVPARNLLHLPQQVPFDVGGLVSCAVITAVHACRKASLSLGSTALVIGAGGIGQILIQLLRSAGVRVIAISRSPSSLDLAIKNGADTALPFDFQTVIDVARDYLGHPDALDCVFDTVGTAETMHVAAALVRRCGRIVVIGEEPECPSIDTIQIAQRELEIVGSRNGGQQDALDAIAFIAANVIRPTVCARFPLVDINHAMGKLRTGRATGRIVIDLKK